ncbi:MAG: hypothetical protein ACI9ZV_000895, partial [Candidatus Azotimanducaceae bacterium]
VSAGDPTVSAGDLRQQIKSADSVDDVVAAISG